MLSYKYISIKITSGNISIINHTFELYQSYMEKIRRVLKLLFITFSSPLCCLLLLFVEPLDGLDR